MNEGPAKRWFFRCAGGRAVTSLARRWARGVAILAYHGVTSAPDGGARNVRRLHVPADLFEAHLKYIRSECEPIPLRRLVDALDSGAELPSRGVVMTFDDGYRNFLAVALPLLRRYEIPATLFVTSERPGTMWEDDVERAIESTAVEAIRWQGTELRLRSHDERRRAMRTVVDDLLRAGPSRHQTIQRLLAELASAPVEASDDDRALLSWAELGSIERMGIEIGSHADRHEPLTERSAANAAKGLADSRRELERRLGPRRYPLAYPYGFCTAGLARATRDAGFYCGLVTEPGLSAAGADPFVLKRFLIGADDDIPRLRASVSGVRALLHWSH